MPALYPSSFDFTKPPGGGIRWTMSVLPAPKMIVGIVLAVLWVWPLGTSLRRLSPMLFYALGLDSVIFRHLSAPFVVTGVIVVAFSWYVAWMLLARVQTVTLTPGDFRIDELVYAPENLLLDIPFSLASLIAAMLLAFSAANVITERWPSDWLMLSAVPGIWLFFARLYRVRCFGGIFPAKAFPETIARILCDRKGAAFALYAADGRVPTLVVPCFEDLCPEAERLLREQYPLAVYEDGRIPFRFRVPRLRRKLPL